MHNWSFAHLGVIWLSAKIILAPPSSIVMIKCHLSISVVQFEPNSRLFFCFYFDWWSPNVHDYSDACLWARVNFNLSPLSDIIVIVIVVVVVVVGSIHIGIWHDRPPCAKGTFLNTFLFHPYMMDTCIKVSLILYMFQMRWECAMQAFICFDNNGFRFSSSSSSLSHSYYFTQFKCWVNWRPLLRCLCLRFFGLCVDNFTCALKMRQFF